MNDGEDSTASGPLDTSATAQAKTKTTSEWQAILSGTKPAVIIAFLKKNKVPLRGFRLLTEHVAMPQNQRNIAQTLVDNAVLAHKWMEAPENATGLDLPSSKFSDVAVLPLIHQAPVTVTVATGLAVAGLKPMHRVKTPKERAVADDKPLPAQLETSEQTVQHPESDIQPPPIATLIATIRDLQTENQKQVMELATLKEKNRHLTAQITQLEKSARFTLDFVERLQVIVEQERKSDFKKYPPDKRPGKLKTEVLRIIRNEATLANQVVALERQLKSVPQTQSQVPNSQGIQENLLSPKVRQVFHEIMRHGRPERSVIQKILALLLTDKTLQQIDIAYIRVLQACVLIHSKDDVNMFTPLSEAIPIFLANKMMDDVLDAMIRVINTIPSSFTDHDVIEVCARVIPQMDTKNGDELVHPLARLSHRNHNVFERLLPPSENPFTRLLREKIDNVTTRKVTETQNFTLTLSNGRKQNCSVQDIINRVLRNDANYIARVREGLDNLSRSDQGLIYAVEACLRDMGKAWAITPLRDQHCSPAVIDASNVARWQPLATSSKSLPKGSRIAIIWQTLVQDGFFPVQIYADANLKHTVSDPEFYTRELVDPGRLTITHGEEADRVILKWALDHDAVIITNDKNMVSDHFDVLPSPDRTLNRIGFEFNHTDTPTLYGKVLFTR